MADCRKISKSFDLHCVENEVDTIYDSALYDEIIAWACDIVAATEREYTNEQARQRALIATLAEALEEIEEALSAKDGVLAFLIADKALVAMRGTGYGG